MVGIKNGNTNNPQKKHGFVGIKPRTWSRCAEMRQRYPGGALLDADGRGLSEAGAGVGGQERGWLLIKGLRALIGQSCMTKAAGRAGHDGAVLDNQMPS